MAAKRANRSERQASRIDERLISLWLPKQLVIALNVVCAKRELNRTEAFEEAIGLFLQKYSDRVQQHEEITSRQ